jgi:uncharacterized protein YneF (UPF0154 family)
MKWLITCLIIIFLGAGILCGYFISISYHVVSSTIEEHNYNNLLILYKIGDK